MLLFFYFGFTSFLISAPQKNEEKIVIYKGKIEEAADYIVHFPTEEEGRETYARLNEIAGSFKSILAEKRPSDLNNRIDDGNETFRLFPAKGQFLLRHDFGVGILTWVAAPRENFLLFPLAKQGQGHWGKAKG